MNRAPFALALAGLLAASIALAADKPLVVDVWPGKVPGEKGNIGEEKMLESKPNVKRPVKRVTNVSKPTLTIFRPASDKDTGAAVVICPGGGYSILAWDLEGEEVATWLNSIGVTGIVLKYRVPTRPDTPKDTKPIGPLQDVQRALSLVRSKAASWNLDPQRIGVLGFSAGGHLAARAATNSDQRAYEASDEADKLSCRPDFTVLIYPAYLLVKNTNDLTPEIRVSKSVPPTFFAHAANDSPEGSVQLFLALKKAGVPAELHVYEAGGHGFGLRKSEFPCYTWPQRCGEWMEARGLLKKR